MDVDIPFIKSKWKSPLTCPAPTIVLWDLKWFVKHINACEYEILNGVFNNHRKGARKDPKYGYQILDYMLCRNFEK